MKKSIISLFLILNIIALQAGKLKGKVQQSGDNGMISISLNGNGGTSMSSGVSNAFSFNPNAGLEISWGNFGLGIEGSTFNTLPNYDFDAYTAPLKTLDFVSISGVNSFWKSTSIVFGPSFSVPLGISKPIPGVGIVVKKNRPGAALTFSIKGGITLNEAPNFTVVNNSSRTTIASYLMPTDYNRNVLTLKPSVVLSYWISQSIALSANVQYAMQATQPPVKTAQKDLTNISRTAVISPDQLTKILSEAPTISSATIGPDKYLSVGVGLTISLQRKGWDGSVKGNRKGINENGLKKNDAEYVLSDAEVKAIAETLVNMRKGWDGSVKGGNIVEKKGIQENGIKENEAKSENTNLRIKTIAETLVNIARKGWDGSVKGNKVAYKPTDSDIELVTETLENIRKGWDGSVKGNKTEYVANGADVKAIAETLVNLRKGWDGSVKGGKIQKTKHDTVKNSINNVR